MSSLKKYCEKNGLDENKTFNMIVGQGGGILPQKVGMQGYIEYSGNRGYHVWVIFSEWIPVRYATMVCDVIEEKVQKEEV